MKPKITREEIIKAYADLKEVGEEPSALNIRKHLGNQGGLGTIQKVLNEYRKDKIKDLDTKATSASETCMIAVVQNGEAKAGAEVKRQAVEIRDQADLIAGLDRLVKDLREQLEEESTKMEAAADRERNLRAELSSVRSQGGAIAMRLLETEEQHKLEVFGLRAQLDEANRRALRYELRAQQLEAKVA